jgi:hypothetical protein
MNSLNAVDVEEVDENMTLASAHRLINYAILKSLVVLLHMLLFIYKPGVFRRISRHDGRRVLRIPSRDQGRSIDYSASILSVRNEADYV